MESEIEKFEALKELGYLVLPDDYKLSSMEQALQDSENNRENLSLQKVFNIESLKASDAMSALKDINIDEVASQKRVMQMFYKSKGFSEAKANDYIERAEDSLKLEEDATEALDYIKEDVKNQAADKINNDKQQSAQKEEAEIARFNDLKTTLQTATDFGNYKIPKQEKEKALQSLYRPVTMTSGETMTEFDYRLNEIVLKDPKLTLALSDILNRMNRDNTSGQFSFNFANIAKTAETKVTKSYKKAIDSITNTHGKGRVNGRQQTEEPKFDWDSVL